jgi:hypothetical protein
MYCFIWFLNKLSPNPAPPPFLFSLCRAVDYLVAFYFIRQIVRYFMRQDRIKNKRNVKTDSRAK